MPTPKKPDPRNCPHRELEFELGGKVLACLRCGQRYHAVQANRPGNWAAPLEDLDRDYYNIWVLHRDRREWAPALAEPVKP